MAAVEHEREDGQPEGGHHLPRAHGQALKQVRLKQSNLAVWGGRVHPLEVVVAELAHLRQQRLVPVDQLLLVG